jgi:trans-2,3-dihydro-3-hydroxyanthranilate isomerase
MEAGMRRRFFTLDVFTNRRFTGNPLAVVLEGGGLDGKTMQAIAREFSHPETVFVLPPVDAAHRARVRIFTPASELQFAGHPTVGTAVALGLLDGGTAEREIVLEEGIGPVHCAMRALDRGRGHARFTIPRQPEALPTPADPARIAAALGLQPDELGCEKYVPGNWSAGNAFTFVPVRGLHAIARSCPDLAHWPAAFGGDNPLGAFLFCRETVERGNAFHARMFAPGLGVPEDPATGSAVAALAGIVARDGGFADGTHELRIEQGYEMGRPSLIVLTVASRGGRLIEAVIGGEAIVVTEGAIEA